MRHWLMKAEPDSRLVKGKDVKFSVDDFEAAGTTAWEGVRNFEARNLMKEMSVGDKVLFYHSNCKNPSIAGFAEVCKGAYPDHTAWDSSHPYYDPKSDKETPKWFMVDARFISRASNFVSLSLLRYIATLSPDNLPEEIAYIGSDGVNAIKEMPLLNRGRLSVQRVSQECWDLIQQMAERGGWENIYIQKAGRGKQKAKSTENTVTKAGEKDSRGDTNNGDMSRRNIDPEGAGLDHAEVSNGYKGRKRKGQLDGETDSIVAPRRKSARTK
ncbi:PUA-like domain-containing protein [Scleroderma yunnanense]